MTQQRFVAQRAGAEKLICQHALQYLRRAAAPRQSTGDLLREKRLPGRPGINRFERLSGALRIRAKPGREPASLLQAEVVQVDPAAFHEG